MEIFHDLAWFFAAWIRIRFIKADPDPADQNETDPYPKHWNKETIHIFLESSIFIELYTTVVVGIRYPCDQCDFTALSNRYLRVHRELVGHMPTRNLPTVDTLLMPVKSRGLFWDFSFPSLYSRVYGLFSHIRFVVLFFL